MAKPLLRGLIGYALPIGAGAGVGSLIGEDEEEKAVATSLGGLTGGLIAQTPYMVASSLGPGMANFAEGFYDMKDLGNLSMSDKAFSAIGGNQAVALKRGAMEHLRGDQIINLQKDLDRLYGKNVRNAVKEFEDYKAIRGNKNATPEELRLKHIYQNSRANNIDTANRQALLKKRIEAELLTAKRSPSPYRTMTKDKEVQKGLDKAWAKEQNRRIRTFEVVEDKALQKGLQREGEHHRKYRHEIAKNEVQTLSWRQRDFNEKRLEKAGYKYKGEYRWRDVKKFMNNKAVKAWENDANKLIRTAYAYAGKEYTGNMMLSDNKVLHVIKNIHRGDRMIPLKLGRKYLDLGERISHQLVDGRLKSMDDVKNYIKTQFTYHPSSYRIGTREMHDYVKKLEEIIEKQGKTMPNGEQWIAKQRARLEARSAAELNKMFINDTAEDMTREIKKGGGFQKKKVFGGKGLRARGHFELSKLGGVSTLYLEGGINTSAQFAPMMHNNKFYVAERILKSDIQDLPLSVQTGLQKNPPLILDEYVRRVDASEIDQTKRVKYHKLKSGHPFGYDNFEELEKKKLNRTEVKRVLRSEKPVNEKAKAIVKAIGNVPKKSLMLGLRSSAKVAGIGGLVALAAYSGLGLYDYLNKNK